MLKKLSTATLKMIFCTLYALEQTVLKIWEQKCQLILISSYSMAQRAFEWLKIVGYSDLNSNSEHLVLQKRISYTRSFHFKSNLAKGTRAIKLAKSYILVTA